MTNSTLHTPPSGNAPLNDPAPNKCRVFTGGAWTAAALAIPVRPVFERHVRNQPADEITEITKLSSFYPNNHETADE